MPHIPGSGQATMVSSGFLEREKAEQMSAEVMAWAEPPDAFLAEPHCELVGWVE